MELYLSGPKYFVLSLKVSLLQRVLWERFHCISQLQLNNNVSSIGSKQMIVAKYVLWCLFLVLHMKFKL